MDVAVTDEHELRKIILAVTDFVRGSEDSQALGAEIGKFVRREFPDFDRQAAGFKGLTDMLERAAPELSIVGRRGADYVWSTVADLDVLDPQLDGDQVSSTGSSDVRPYLDGFKASGFKALDGIKVSLRRFNVIVGANGAGKTSILEGLFTLSQLRFKKPETIFSGPRRLDRLRTANSAGPVRLAARSGSQYIEYEGVVRPDDFDQHQVVIYDGETKTEYDFTRTLLASFPRELPLMRAFGGAALLRLEARRLARPAVSPRERPTLRHDGSGLPVVLADLAATDRDRFDRIVQATAEIIPALQGVRMPRYRFDDDEVGNDLELQLNGRWISASLASEGTMLVLGLMTIVHGLTNSRLLLMDDVDRALHPKAQRKLIKQLVELTKAADGLQLVCTTHSPYLLDAVDAEDVLVARASPETGLARCRHLVEHEAWDKWRTSMTPGEFWSYVGEDWLESE